MRTGQLAKAKADRQVVVRRMRVIRGLLVAACLLVPGLALAQVPFIQQVIPSSAAPGSSLSLTINGANFISGTSVVNLTVGTTVTALTTTFVSAAQLTATGTAPSASSAFVTVVNPGTPTLTSNAVPIPLTSKGNVSFADLNIKVGAGPQAVALGDFNNDGKLDLVIVNSTDNTVSILLSNGDGTFDGPGDSTLPSGPPPGPPSPTYSVGHNPVSVAVGDFNNDGKLDLAVANENDNTVSILLGNGDGTFQTQKTVPSNGTVPVSVATADFNADGNLDLAVVNQTDSSCGTGNGSVSVLTSDGKTSPSFSVLNNRICVGILPTSVVVGDFSDFDALGLPDLVVVNEGGGNASCAPANGTVTFASAAVVLVGPPFASASSYCACKSPSAAAVGDFNDDGILDVAVTNFQGNSASVLLGNSSGFGFNFQSPNSFPTGGLGANSITVGDFNGDGTLDLAVASQGSSQVSILLGDGSGNFNSAPGSPFTTTTAAGGRGPASLVAADFNGDGKLDIATADNTDNLLTVMVQAPALAFACVSAAPSSPGSFGCSGTPPILTFGNEPEDTTSPALTVMLTNTGSTALNLDSITVTGANPADFPSSQLTTTCGNLPGTLAAGASCNVSAVFSPNTIGTLLAALTVTEGNNLSQSVTLSGSGIAPAIGFSPQTVTFPATLVGSMNASPQTVTVSNIGDFDTTLGSVTISGTNSSDFKIPGGGDTCSGQKLTAGSGTCTITVNFTPLSGGLRTAQINVPFSISGSTSTITQTVPLAGDGAAPAVNLAPTPLTFGNQPVGTTSSPGTVTLLNDGTYALTIASTNGVAISGPNAGDFKIQSDPCPVSPSTVAVDNTCTVAITFTPSATGTENATLTFTDNNNASAGSTQAVGLVGNGAAAVVSLAIAPQTFGNQQVGTTSGPATVTLSNIGTAPLTINSIVKGGANAVDFAIQSNGCPSPGTLAVSSSCIVTVTFTPSAADPRSATLVFTDNNNGAADPPGVTQTVNLTGTGTAPAVGLAGLSGGNTLAFGGVPVGTSSAPLSFTLSNVGTAPLAITSIISSDPSEFVASSCPASLPPNANCIVSVTFSPAATGLHSATLTITDNSGGSPSSSTTQTVSLSGTGTSFSISVTPASQTVSPGKFATYTLTLTPITGFTGTVSLGCSVTPAASKTTCTTPILAAVNGTTTFFSASAKNSSKGTFTLNFFATFNAASPATGTVSKSTSATVTVK